MSRKRRLSPHQGDVLRALEEAGEDTLSAILNTLGLSPDDHGGVPASFARDLDGLLRMGFVSWSRNEANPLALLEFEAGHWRLPPSESGERLSLLLTEAGERALAE